jgi:hypothetical protein
MQGLQIARRTTMGADLGLEVVNRVRRRPEWAHVPCTVWPRGLTWLPLGVTQRVWSEPSPSYPGAAAWRVQVRSDLLTGFTGSPAQLAALSLDMPTSPLAAIVRSRRGETRLQLASTLHVHGGNVVWAADFVAFVARQQAREARRLAQASALLSLGASPDVAGQAEEEPVDAAAGHGLTEQLAAAPQSDAGLWTLRDVQLAVKMLSTLRGVRATPTSRGLSATFTSPNPSAGDGVDLLELDTASRWPGLGRGLSVLLVPPGRGGTAEALVLNEGEIAPGCCTDLLGGWSARDGLLQHSAFFPDAVHTKDLLTDVVLAAVRRVVWLRPGRSQP